MKARNSLLLALCFLIMLYKFQRFIEDGGHSFGRSIGSSGNNGIGNRLVLFETGNTYPLETDGGHATLVSA